MYSREILLSVVMLMGLWAAPFAMAQEQPRRGQPDKRLVMRSARLPSSRPQPRCSIRLIGLAVILAVSVLLAPLAAEGQQAQRIPARRTWNESLGARG